MSDTINLLPIHPEALPGFKSEYLELENSIKAGVLNNSSDFGTPGIQQVVTTQSQIVAGVVRQKFYTLMGQTPSDFVPIRAGEGAYSTEVRQYVAAQLAKTGQSFINPSHGIKKSTQTSIMFDTVGIPNNFWRNEYGVSNTQMQVAERNYGSAFSLVEENEKARFQLFQLDFQETFAKGIEGTGSYGLFNNPVVTVNHTLMPKALHKMTLAEVRTLCGNMRNVFAKNADMTEMFNTWSVPTEEYLGINTPISDTYSTRTIRSVIEECFADIPGFKIVHSVYQNKSTNFGMGEKARHVLYRKDKDTLCMFAPLVYTPYALHPVNGADYVSIAEAQWTGVLIIRPKEVLYVDTQA